MAFHLDVHLDPQDLDAALRADALAGLARRPRALPPKWFYDDLGSRLFDAITALDEYYPTRRETEILLARAVEIAAAAPVETLVELGSGTSTKTRILLEALGPRGSEQTPPTARGSRRRRRLHRFVPFEVSETTLRSAARTLMAEYPWLEVHGVVGDFERHLVKLPGGDRRLVAFLGGTIGNLSPSDRQALLEDLGAVLDAGELLLLGTDLVKAEERLVRAYDDPTGVTAAFNRNLLSVLNRRLGADFDTARFSHLARWDAENEWMEMHLVSERAQRVSIPGLGMVLDFEPGESIRTEISAKFRRDRLEAELTRAGFGLQHWWTDVAGEFALSLWERR